MRFLRDEAGATAIEYALIGGLISIVIVAAIGSMSASLGSMFQAVTAGFTH